MAEDGSEPGIIAGQGRRETTMTGEDGGGRYRTWHHSWTLEEGAPMTGEDGRGWYRTWHHSCTREEGDAHDRRRWQRMVPNLAS